MLCYVTNQTSFQTSFQFCDGIVPKKSLASFVRRCEMLNVRRKWIVTLALARDNRRIVAGLHIAGVRPGAQLN